MTKLAPVSNPRQPKAGTVQAKVLDYLKTGHSLDLPKAIALWGHIRLSDAIHKLRVKGYEIITDIATSSASHAEFGIYRLKQHDRRARLIKGPYKGLIGTITETPNGLIKFKPEGSSREMYVLADMVEVFDVAA